MSAKEVSLIMINVATIEASFLKMSPPIDMFRLWFWQVKSKYSCRQAHNAESNEDVTRNLHKMKYLRKSENVIRRYKGTAVGFSNITETRKSNKWFYWQTGAEKEVNDSTTLYSYGVLALILQPHLTLSRNECAMLLRCLLEVGSTQSSTAKT